LERITVLPIGEEGELVIGGSQVAQGYLNRPKLSAAAFIQDDEFGCLYRTGDKARILPNRTLECLGRLVSGQVKLRGQRVELGEIEQIISKVDGCHTASVMVINDNLVAFCAIGSREVSKSSVKDVCIRWLPSHMVPADIVFLPHMPQSAAGKTDKKYLEESYLQEDHRKVYPTYHPTSEAGQIILRILHRVLDRDISLNTTLATVGLDSLRAIRIASLLREEGYHVGALDVLSTIDLEELISVCGSKKVKSGTGASTTSSEVSNFPKLEIPGLVQHDDQITDILPCTPLQAAMLAETIKKPDAYCNWIETELSFPHSFTEIRDFLEKLAHHHEILRSGFCTSSSTSNSFAQVVWKKLGKYQISEVTSFSRRFCLGSSDSMLRPLTIQVNATLLRPRLLFQIHHALYDGWSFDLLMRDLGRIIDGRTVNRRPQYREVVRYYSEVQDSEEHIASSAYWSNILEGYYPTPLPNYNGSILQDSTLRAFSGKSSVNAQDLYSRASECGLNPQVFFQAAVAHIVGSYLGSSDVVIGTVTSGRTVPVTGIEEIVGPCIASLPLRCDLSSSITANVLLEQIHRANRDMLQHCTLPLRDITKICNLHPDNRLFDVLFVWQETLLDNDDETLSIRIVDSADNVEFSITLEFEPHKDCILYKIRYDPSIFPQEQIGYLSAQIDEVVNLFVHNSNGTTEDIAQCFSEQSLSAANQSPIQKRFMHGPAHAVEEWALRDPEKEALVIGTAVSGIMTVQHRLTYAALNKRANQLAHALLEHGAGNDQLVCVLMEKSTDFYVSVLAVLKTGSGYLPIVLDSPVERTKTILADARIKICISESSASQFLRDEGSYTILDMDGMDFSTYSDQNLHLEYNGSHLAYAVFTSGSTGTPKGVLVTQDNLMSNLDVLQRLYPTSNESRLLQACSQAFDVSVFEIFFTWYTGMCLCTATKDNLFHNFEDSINRLGITHLSLTPTVASLVNPNHVPKVNFLVTAGEAVNEHVRRQWADRGLYQAYGPSETTNVCTVRPAVTSNDLINNIGPPLSNTSAFVLDPESDRLIPRGGIGELCFGGAQVFRGYLNMPEMTARKVIIHPTYGRIYRSGDMGLLLPDDSILFTGRSDDQVKIRGQRVELGEVTSNILDNDVVDDCVTLLFCEENGQRLIAFWVPKKGHLEEFSPIDPYEYRHMIWNIFESLSLRVPAYMMPTHLVPISRIPMTSQTKVDKRLLESTFYNLPAEHLEALAYNYSSTGDEEVFSDAERKIVEVLAQTTGVPINEIRRTSSFFNLGLDSISAINLSGRLRDSGIANVPVSTILKNPTVALLSLQLSSGATKDVSSKGYASPISEEFFADHALNVRNDCTKQGMRVRRILPCTPLQEAMLSSAPSVMEASYFNTMVFNINGEVSRVQECWSLMIKRHEILRTAFVPTDDPQFAFAQVILDFEPIKWDRLEEVEDLQVYARRVIPPLLDSFQPPIRFATYETAASTKLIFCCHHALYDGTAISVLLNELQESYLGRELSPVVAYDSYLQRMVSQDFSAADKFWTSSFANFEPTFFPDLSGQSGHINTRSSSLTKILRYPLSGFLKSCRESSVSLLPVVQTAWIKLLHFYTGESDICFGNVVSGRSLPEENLYQLVAPCFNTLPVRLHFDYQRSNSDLVQQLHNLNIESLPFQLTPLRRIQSKVRSEGGALFDTLVILQQPNEPLDSSIWTLEQDIGDMDVPIVCEVSQNKADNWLSLTLHYRTSLLSEDDAKIVVDTFEHALESLVQFPDAAAGDTIEFPSQILAESNMDFQRLDPANGELLHSAMEYNAVSRPDSIALDFQFTHGKQTTCTFKELNEKANQIAHALLQRDVKPEDIVPVYMPKSPQFYASILGVLKAGAAFTPIHPDLPTARKQFMLQEIQPKVLLCIDDESLYWYGGIFALNVNTVEDYPRNNPTVDDILPTNLAYCLYTSGSTGVPKAVSMEHRSPIQTIESSRSLIPWTHNSRLLQYAAITFDMCYYDCFLAWSLGFALCAAEQSAMINDITSVIKSLDVDLLDLTPSVAISLSRADVPSVKWLYCIGEPISTEIIEQWNGACVNAYGPTEAAFCTTIFPVQRGVKNSVIGKPFLTTSFAVFPAKGQRSVPVFGVGELYIGGAQLARGYYGNTRLTEEKFVQRSGQRFYKSGDLVRMLGDGNFEFIGRTDDQVKIRGLRVELGEINHVLQDCDEKFSAVSTQILKKNKDAKPQLVAFLVVQASVNEQDISELKCKAKKVATSTLPAYMIPQFYIFINQIPKSMAGKVDKNALANHFQELEDSSDKTQDDSEKAHNWSNTETHIREIFARLSKTPLEEIHPYTSIYQLGLDSISAVQVAAAMRKKGYMANAADVLKHMNCADISTHLESHIISGQEVVSFDFESFDRRFRPEIVQACGVRQEDIEAVRPCTPLQRGMLSQFIANDGAVYLNHIRLQLDRGVELTCMQKAWASAMNRHVMLRTGFAHAKDSKHPFAMIHYTTSAFSVPWEDSDLEHLDPTEKWLQKLRRQTLKHLHQPPWYIRVFKMKGSMYLDLVMFHALFDATSLRAIFTDVSKIYQAAELSPTVPLEPVLSNILHQSSDQDAQHNRFWETLGKEATSTRFPNLAPLRYDSETPSVLVKSCTKPISDLETGCRASNITLQAAGLASWASLLSAYSGEPSVTFGIVLSGRNFDAAESAVIPCITTVPFVCKVSDDKGSMLAHIMSSSAEVQQHQFTPLNEIQRMMGCSNEVLFDSLFAFQKLSNGGGQEHPWTVVDEHATIEYPVSIEMEPIDGRLELRLTFLSHLIPKEHAVLILDQLDHLINNFVFLDAPPMAEASSDPILYSITPAKEDTLSSDVTLLHEFVEISAVKHPSRIAFEFATSIKDGKYTSINWTYSQLDIEGNRVAHMLIAHGICPGELVGVCFDKCPEASFAILGILKAGCAFVALDPGLPIARREFIIQDSRAKVVLSMNAQSWDMHEIPSVRVLSLDEMDLRSTLTTKPNLQREVGSQDRSYCLYTSGTTGTPKGCELTHENAVQALLSFQRLFAGHWDDQSRWLQFASFHFDVSVLEQYWSWSVGICVVSAPRDLIFEDLTTSIRTLGITHIDLTPSLARIVHPDDVPDLCKGVFITGGESLKQEILDAWGPKGVIYNGYGPTEATIGCTMYPRVPANGKPSNIGPQFDNVGSYVFRPGTEIPVLRGGVGELCVSGKLVGKGYLNRPELTEERFPHLQTFCERVYRTGDLVRILYDGSIDFLGRADDQVKLRGQRLEIGEINAVIRQAATEISDVATFVLRHPKQRKEQLVSFVVTAAKSKEKPRILLQSTRELAIAKEACQDRLPAYMVPTHFVALTALPLSTNNKADARKLKEMYEDLSVNDLQILSGPTDAEDDKWSRQEKKIRDVLREMLQVGEVDIKKGSSFFELGMDSVSVIGFSRALKQAGFSKAVASLIMKNTTISRLAKALSKKNHTPSDRGSILAAQQSITAIQHRHRRDIARALFMDPREIEAIAPCTPLQQGMIARSLDNGEGLYFNTFLFKLDKDVDMDKLQDAWQQMIESTQILRTVFWNTEDGFVQAALKRLRFPWKTCSISNNEALDEFLHELKRKWLQDNRMVPQRPFEVILVDAPKGKTLVVHIFHALYDGNSIVMMFKAIWNIYNDRPSEKPGPSFQSALAYGPLRVIEGAQAFWKEHIRRSSFNLLSAHANGSDKGTIEITRELRNLSKYESVRRQLNVTAQAIAQACWATVLNKHTKHAVTIGMVMSGRSFDFEHADRIVGPLFNTIPHPNRIRNGDTWATIIKSTHDFNVAAHPYQHTPLRDIAKWCRPSLNQPLLDTLFVFQAADTDEEWMKNDVWTLEVGGAEADYPLALEVEQNPGGSFKLTLVAQGNALDELNSIRLLDEFEEALRDALDAPDATVEGLSVDGTDWSTTEQMEPKSASVSFDGAKDFKWTIDTLRMREEVANLAGVEMEVINEATSIFELGLDSIDAIKLSSKLKKHNINLAVSSIMRGRTIANMAINILKSKIGWAQRPSDMIFRAHIRRLEAYLQRQRGQLDYIEKVLPLTPLQEAMVAEMVASDYTRYYNHDVLKLAPDTDVEQLRHSWLQVVKGSPILRTSFVEIDDPHVNSSFAQVVQQSPHDFWKHMKTSGIPDFPRIFDTIREDVAKTPLASPLFHVHFIDSGAQKYLVLSIAHALYDGWSLGLLHSDVHRAYLQHYKPRPGYDYALLVILTTSGAEAAGFWRDFLSEAKPSHFPRRVSEKDKELQIVHREELTTTIALNTIASFAKKNNITLQTLGQTVYALVLAYYAQSLDVTFGSVLSGRDNEDTSEILFPTMNTVAIRTILHGTRREMLQYVQDNFTNIKQWQHFPLRKAQALARIPGNLLGSLFIYQKRADARDSLGPKLYESVESRSDVEYPVCVEMEVINKELLWRCAVKDGVLDKAGARDLLQRLDEVLKTIIEQPDAPVVEFLDTGRSICGLPTFKDEKDEREEKDEDSDHEGSTSEEQVPSRSESVTAKAIRETLALVSKIPEDEIAEGMTIFHIGLDSISAIKVSSLLRKRSIILSVGEMLKAGTVEKMAQVVDQRAAISKENDNDTEAILNEALSVIDRAAVLDGANIEVDNIEQILPATAGQIYMLSMWLNSNGTKFYPSFSYNVNGLMSISTLQTAWQAFVKLNPILRTCFLTSENSSVPYIQVVLKDLQPEVMDTTGWDEQRISDTIEKDAHKQPYCHLFASQLPNGWSLTLKIHHALYDGVSLPLMMDQLQGFCNGNNLPPAINTFNKLLAANYTASALENRKTFWTNYLHGIEQHDLGQSSSPSTSKIEIFKHGLLPTVKILNSLARKNGVSTQSLFLAAYAKIYAGLKSTAKDQDVVIGIYLANRSLPIPNITSATIPTVNLVPLRISRPLETNILDVAAQIQYDIQEISIPANSMASLYDIYVWTGIKIDTFVNFLKLPDSDGSTTSSKDRDIVNITPVGQWNEDVSRVEQTPHSGFETPKELVDESVCSVYMVCIFLNWRG
jgi:amino acid adenylation domain-containing protein